MNSATLAHEVSDDGILRRAAKLRHDGNYEEAVKTLEEAIQNGDETDTIWRELALAQYQEWHQFVTQLHKPGGLTLTMGEPIVPILGGQLLQKAYNSFVVAMEYPENKKQPTMLVKMVMLYLEFQAYRGALSVCTLLVEGYSTHASIHESILLCAISAKALQKHRESAQYFQYLVEKPPFRLAPYYMLLLAGLELEKVADMREQVRETYSLAYKEMIKLSPVTSSEKEAHLIYKTSHKNESQRIQMWFLNDGTWFDMATRFMNLNFPILVCDVIEVVERRGHVLPREVLIMAGIAHYRMGNVDRAVQALASALQADYWLEHCRCLLNNVSDVWRKQFRNEETSAICIQRTTRRHWMRVAWRTTACQLMEEKRQRSALSIQCAWRQFVARCERAELLDARRKQEQNENDLLAAEDWLLIMRVLNSASVKIQSLHKIIQAKREVQLRRALRNKRNHLLNNFVLHRASTNQIRGFHAWMKFVELQKLERQNAASSIQRCIRSFLSRRLHRRLLQARSRQEQIVLLCLGRHSVAIKGAMLKKWQRFTVEQRGEKNEAAIRIQRLWQRYIARKKYRHELRRHVLATELMHRMLADKGMQRLRTTWSALVANAVFHRMQKYHSAVVIQRHARAMIARRFVRKLRSRRRRVVAAVTAMRSRSAKQLLRRVFDSFVRFIEMQWELRDGSALKVQRVFRGFAARKRVRFLIECNRILKEPGMTLRGRADAYVKLVCFLLLARLPEQNRMERHRAGARILKWYRQTRKRRQIVVALSKLRRQRAILNTLQATFRSMALLFFNELKRQVGAKRWRRDRMAHRIQRAAKAWITYRRYQRVLLMRDSRKSRAAVHARQQQLKMVARCLQEWHRVVRFEKDLHHNAAVRIQRMYRARVAKQQAQRVLSKRAARARLLESLHLKPLERWFGRWDEVMVEKNVAAVRVAAKSNGASISPDKWRMAMKWESSNPHWCCAPKLTLEHRAELSSLLFYTLLHRVRQTGILQLSFAGGLSSITTPQLHQLLTFASSVIVDGGGAQLVELVINAMATLERPCPAQKLIFYNAKLSVTHATTLYSVLKHPGSAITSLVLSNISLTSAAVTAIAISLCPGHGKLEQLVLEACSVGNAGAAAIAEAVGYSQHLWKLDLSQNHIGDGAAAALAHMLMTSVSLRVLSLSGNALSDRGVLTHVAPAMAAAHPHLETVVLRTMPRISLLGQGALQHATTSRCVVLLD